MAKTIELYIVNAFTDGLNTGSPTGVVLSADGLTEKQMLKIAGFLGVSHTALFLTQMIMISEFVFSPKKMKLKIVLMQR